MLLALASLAAAQDGGATQVEGQVVSDGALPTVNGQLFRPSIDASSTLWTDESLKARNGYTSARATLHYVNDPLRYVESDGQVHELVSGLWQLSVGVGHTRGPVRLGLDLPVYLRSQGEATGGETGLGDIGVEARVTALDRRTRPLGLAFAGRLGVPTSTVQAPLGNGGFGYELGLVVDKELGERTLVAANLGMKGVQNQQLENLEWRDQAYLRLGLGHALTPSTGLSLDVVGHSVYGTLLGPDSNPAGRPVEALAGAWHRLGPEGSWVIRGGAGTGLTGGIGAPRMRALASVAWEPPREPKPEPVPVVQAEPEPEPELPPVPEPARLEVLVVDPAGRQVSGATFSTEGGPRLPASSPHELPAGSHELRVVAEGYRPAQASVVLDEGVSEQLRVVLEPSQAVVAKERIEISGSVYFETSSDRIKTESFGLMDDVAAVMKEHPELLKVRIEGHTDSRGDAAFNKALSQRRAEAVKRALEERGVDSVRLVAEGYGEERPIDASETAEAWSQNRRVEFYVLERSED